MMSGIECYISCFVAVITDRDRSEFRALGRQENQSVPHLKRMLTQGTLSLLPVISQSTFLWVLLASSSKEIYDNDMCAYSPSS